MHRLMILCSAVSGLNIAGSYKTFGSKQPHLNSDTFLSLVGALSAIGGNAAGRFFWGSLSDKRGFKACFSALTLLQGLTMYNYGRLASYRKSSRAFPTGEPPRLCSVCHTLCAP